MTSFVHETDKGAELLFELDEKTGTVSAMTYEASDLYMGLFPIAEKVEVINPTTGSNCDAYMKQWDILKKFEDFMWDVANYESMNAITDTDELNGTTITFDCGALFYAGYQVLANGNGVLGFYFPNQETQMVIVGEDVEDIAVTLRDWVNDTRHWLHKHRKELIV